MQVLFPRQREKYSFSGAQSAMSSNPTFSLKKSPSFQKTLITRRKFVTFTQFVFSPAIDADSHSQNTCNLLGNTFFLDSNFFFLAGCQLSPRGKFGLWWGVPVEFRRSTICVVTQFPPLCWQSEPAAVKRGRIWGVPAVISLASIFPKMRGIVFWKIGGSRREKRISTTNACVCCNTMVAWWKPRYILVSSEWHKMTLFSHFSLGFVRSFEFC